MSELVSTPAPLLLSSESFVYRRDASFPPILTGKGEWTRHVFATQTAEVFFSFGFVPTAPLPANINVRFCPDEEAATLLHNLT